jgi:hypothetical protein
VSRRQACAWCFKRGFNCNFDFGFDCDLHHLEAVVINRERTSDVFPKTL